MKQTVRKKAHNSSSEQAKNQKILLNLFPSPQKKKIRRPVSASAQKRYDQDPDSLRRWIRIRTMITKS
jgi:hypothetical protein